MDFLVDGRKFENSFPAAADKAWYDKLFYTKLFASWNKLVQAIRVQRNIEMAVGVYEFSFSHLSRRFGFSVSHGSNYSARVKKQVECIIYRITNNITYSGKLAAPTFLLYHPYTNYGFF